MNFNIEEIITLDDGREYIVASHAIYENDKYYFFIDYETNNKIKYFKEDKETLGALIEVKNHDLIIKIAPLLVKNASHIFKEVLKQLRSEELNS